MPHLHVTVLAAVSGNIFTALALAARAAFLDLRIPATKVVSSAALEDVAGGEHDDDLMGIKAAVRAGRQRRGRGRQAMHGADEWELDPESEDLRVEERAGLPVVVTLNLVSYFRLGSARAHQCRFRGQRWCSSMRRLRKKSRVPIGYSSSIMATAGYAVCAWRVTQDWMSLAYARF